MTDTTTKTQRAKITVWLIGGQSIELDVTDTERHIIVTQWVGGTPCTFGLHDFAKGRSFYVHRSNVLLIQTDAIDPEP